MNTRVVQKVLNFTETLDFLDTSHLCMDLTSTEIKTEIWISFSSFIRSGSVLPQQKYLAMALSLNFLNDPYAYHSQLVNTAPHVTLTGWLLRGRSNVNKK